MGGSKQTQQTQQQSNPWAPATPLLNDVLSNAQKYGNDTSLFKPTFSGSTMGGIAGLENLAQNPTAQSGVLQNLIDGSQRGYNTGFNTLDATANGSMLNNVNPYLDAALGTASQRTADAVNAQFSGAGRFGSGAHTGVLADRLGAIETNARMGNYDAERQRQLAAAGQLHQAGGAGAQYAGQMDASNVAQQQLLLQAGGMRDQMDAAQRQAPLNATQWMAQMGTPIAGLGGSSNGTTTTTTPANTAGMITGGLMAGAGILTGNPMMALNGLSSATGGSNLGSFGGLGGSAAMNNWGNVGQSTVGAGGLPKLGGLFS